MKPVPKSDICQKFYDSFGGNKPMLINSIEFISALYYTFLFLMGVRNIYAIFYKQGKYSSTIFPLMYLFTQIVCVLQVVQNFLFFYLNERLEHSC